MTANTDQTTSSTPPVAPTALRRSRGDRMVAGVCGGLAPQLGVDVAVLRIVMVVLAVLGGGAGLVVYAACWLLIPDEE